MYGEKKIREQILDLKFEIGARSFFQVHTFLSEKMVAYVQSQISALGKGLRVLDLFCGSGFFGLSGAKSCESVTGIDSEISSIEEGRANAQKNGISNYSFYAGDAETQVKKMLAEGKNFDIVIVDPPRRGLGKSLCDIIVQSKGKYIFYVSCDPVTLARDVRYLVDSGFSMKSIQPFDMFPQTTHMENIVVLERNERSEK